MGRKASIESKGSMDEIIEVDEDEEMSMLFDKTSVTNISTPSLKKGGKRHSYIKASPSQSSPNDNKSLISF